ncbi:MAG TPA: APC family permease [Polyangiaceae bacterium]|nr:APC family permease [Polyangiaceae bacterium]
MSEASQAPTLRANSIGLAGVLMQGLATIAPAFAILSTFVFTVGLAGLAAPVAYLVAGVFLLPLTIAAGELARAFPSAGGWYTWIARSLSPRAGFFAGWYVTLWLPLAPTLIFAYVSSTVLMPAVSAEYGVQIPVWLWTSVGVGAIALAAYRGVQVSERVLIVTGLAEIAIMLALAVTGLLNPGRGGLNLAPFDPSRVPPGGSLFVAVVFSIFAYSGWEAVAPLAEESKEPRRNVPRALTGSVLAMIVFLVLSVWGYLVGLGTEDVASIATSKKFPVFELAKRVWGPAWVLGPLAMLNSALAASAACFNGGTRTWFGMARSGSLPKSLAKVHPKRKTPDNAISLMLACQLLSGLTVVGIDADSALPVWAFALTFGLIAMYILASLGVLKYYGSEGRAERSAFKHVVCPALSIVAMLVVAYKSLFPLPDPRLVVAVYFFFGYTALGGVVLLYLKLTGRDAWLAEAGEAAESALKGAPEA